MLRPPRRANEHQLLMGKLKLTSIIIPLYEICTVISMGIGGHNYEDENEDALQLDGYKY